MSRYIWESPDDYLADLETAETEEERNDLLLLLLALPVTGRYRDTRTGRFVSPAIVRVELDQYLAKATDPVGALAEQLREGQININDWHTAMRREIKNTHLNAAANAVGGFDNMTPADYGRAGQIIRTQYSYLRNFADEIVSGEQKLDGTLSRRAKMYVDAGRETYYKTKHAKISEVEQASGQRAVIGSVLNPADHCAECVSFDLDQNPTRWFFLSNLTAVFGSGRYKEIGNRACRKNCKCSERTAFYIDGEIVGETAV